MPRADAFFTQRTAEIEAEVTGTTCSRWPHLLPCRCVRLPSPADCSPLGGAQGSAAAEAEGTPALEAAAAEAGATQTESGLVILEVTRGSHQGCAGVPVVVVVVVLLLLPPPAMMTMRRVRLGSIDTPAAPRGPRAASASHDGGAPPLLRSRGRHSSPASFLRVAWADTEPQLPTPPLQSTCRRRRRRRVYGACRGALPLPTAQPLPRCSAGSRLSAHPKSAAGGA